VELGAYDDRILRWLAGWEPATCAVIAGFVSRANLPADAGTEPRRTAARAVLARFDDEVTACSTGAVDNVPEPDWRSWAWHLAAQLRTLLQVTGEQAATLEVARDALLDEPEPPAGIVMAAQLAAIQVVLDQVLGDEYADRQYALEQIHEILRGDL
jgi:hypothetical protein